MNTAKFAIVRPIFIACLVILMLVTGIVGLNRMGVDLFPPIDFPMITVTTIYPGATPEEVEKLISKPLEEQISTISGLKRLSSRNSEGISVVVAEFSYETQVKYAEEKMREKVALARNNLPNDLLNEPLVRQFDFTDMPVVTLALTAKLPSAELYDLAKERIKALIEQEDGVGEVRLMGGTRREIQVELDREKLNAYEIPATTVADQLRISGANVPVGKYDKGDRSTSFKTVGEFRNIEQIKKTLISFSGEALRGVTVDSLGTVRDGTEEVSTLAYLYYPVSEKKDEKGGILTRLFSKEKERPVTRELVPCIVLDVFKQSGANSVAVADGVKKRIGKVNEILKRVEGNPRLVFVYDTARYIRVNVRDVQETMIIGIILAVIVVYLFLGNIRSTIITGVAIPNSIIGAFAIMYFMGFTLNIMTLMALSLAVGLLVDDAIVVRENIYRKIEGGLHPTLAAEKGTTEVMLAVIATTMTIIAVFLPIAFMQGIVGRFFIQFGLCVVFAMAISLFDALTVAPLLSAYFAGSGEKAKNLVVRNFEKLQEKLDHYYGKIIDFSLAHPVIIIAVTGLVFLGSLGAFIKVGKTFVPEADESEFTINMELPAGSSLQGTRDTAMKIMEKVKKIPELDFMCITVGTAESEYNKAGVNVLLVPLGKRNRSSMEIKAEVRGMLKEFSYALPSVDEYRRGSEDKPFMVNIKGVDLDELQVYSSKLLAKIKEIPDLTEVSTSYKQGKPEFQVHLDEQKMHKLGVNNRTVGTELRYHIEGGVVGKFRDKGLEYDVRMRLKPEQRDLKNAFHRTKVPNIQNRMIPLSAVSSGKSAVGPAKIIRQDRSRVVQIAANIGPGGAVGSALERTRSILEKEMPLPDTMGYSFIGEADSFSETVTNMVTAFVLSLIFIYLVLASLYESFFTPIIIFLALPPAMAGAFYALFATGTLMDLFSMIGLVMLLGLVTKNSILLVDFALAGVRSGMSRKEAIRHAGQVRLRPILMTTFAMLAGMLPLALGLGEAAQYRKGMGIAIIGGLIVSTLITLVVVPAVFEFVDRLREAVEKRFRTKPIPQLEAGSVAAGADPPEAGENRPANNNARTRKRR